MIPNDLSIEPLKAHKLETYTEMPFSHVSFTLLFLGDNAKLELKIIM